MKFCRILSLEISIKVELTDDSANESNRSISSRVSFVSCHFRLSWPSLSFFRSVREMSDPQTERIYCAQQINIPPTFPHILKLYAKAAIRTQPYDLLRWTAAYFRALANGEVPPTKVRFIFVQTHRSCLAQSELRIDFFFFLLSLTFLVLSFFESIIHRAQFCVKINTWP